MKKKDKYEIIEVDEKEAYGNYPFPSCERYLKPNYFYEGATLGKVKKIVINPEERKK